MSRLQAIAEDVWIADGPAVSFFGFPYPTRMAVIRLPEGVWVWSPISPEAELLREIEAIGPVKWLVEPNKLHHIFLGMWLEQFPSAAAFAPPGLRKKCSGIDFAGDLGDEPEPAWAEWIDQAVVRGSRAMEEVVFFHRPSATCIVGDLIQRFEADSLSGWKRWLMKADSMVGDRGSTPREWRATFLRRKAARAALNKMIVWQPERLVIAHGSCALTGGAEVVRDSLSWIQRPWPA